MPNPWVEVNSCQKEIMKNSRTRNRLLFGEKIQCLTLLYYNNLGFATKKELFRQFFFAYYK